MRESVIAGWQVPLGPKLMLGVFSLNVLVLHETLLVAVLMYGSETMFWKDVQMDNLRD